MQWIRRYILFHHKRHPKEMGNAEIEAFLTHLVVEGRLSTSTQNQALSDRPCHPISPKFSNLLPIDKDQIY
ncbi:MAG: phage integrase N-terminal SAM-like domain-containing protein [Leptolyngbyaceae cyanobacterium]